MTEAGDISWIRVIITFCAVLALMAGLGGALKYLSSHGVTLGPKSLRPKRLKVVESLILDTRRRCVIVRCDEREHLLLLGHQNDIVVETNLPPAKDKNVSC